MPCREDLRVDVPAPCVVHWSDDDWVTAHDAPSRHTGLGRHVVDLSTADYAGGTGVVFTLDWPDDDRWEGVDYRVAIATAAR